MRLRSAAQYLRMSKESQRYSPENQAAVIAEYAARHGYRIEKTYIDAGRSGVSTKGRAGLASLLTDVMSGSAPFAAVLVLDVSRWGRYQDPDEAGHYEFLCRTAGIDVHYCGEQFEPGLAGSVFKHIKRVMAGEYSRELSAKVRASKARNALVGNTPGGTCRYGFARQVVNVDGSLGPILARGDRKPRPEQTLRMVPEGPEQTRVIRLIFKLFLDEQMGPAPISRRLATEGLGWIDGTEWNKKRVVDVLRCHLVTGVQPFGKSTHRLGGGRTCNPPAAWGMIDVFPPLVSKRRFGYAQARLQALRGHFVKTDDELLEDLRKVHRKHGRVTIVLLESEPWSQSPQVYFKRFGSFSEAYRLAGIAYKGRTRGRLPDGSHMSRAEIIEGIRRLHAENGMINMPLCHLDERLPPLNRIRVEFGSLSEAFDEAGVRHTANSGARRRKRRDADGFIPQVVPGSQVYVGPYGGRYTISPSGIKRYSA